jgi:hypothetical protein
MRIEHTVTSHLFRQPQLLLLHLGRHALHPLVCTVSKNLPCQASLQLFSVIHFSHHSAACRVLLYPWLNSESVRVAACNFLSQQLAKGTPSSSGTPVHSDTNEAWFALFDQLRLAHMQASQTEVYSEYSTAQYDCKARLRVILCEYRVV